MDSNSTVNDFMKENIGETPETFTLGNGSEHHTQRSRGKAAKLLGVSNESSEVYSITGKGSPKAAKLLGVPPNDSSEVHSLVDKMSLKAVKLLGVSDDSLDINGTTEKGSMKVAKLLGVGFETSDEQHNITSKSDLKVVPRPGLKRSVVPAKAAIDVKAKDLSLPLRDSSRLSSNMKPLESQAHDHHITNTKGHTTFKALSDHHGHHETHHSSGEEEGASNIVKRRGSKVDFGEFSLIDHHGHHEIHYPSGSDDTAKKHGSKDIMGEGPSKVGSDHLGHHRSLGSEDLNASVIVAKRRGSIVDFDLPVILEAVHSEVKASNNNKAAKLLGVSHDTTEGTSTTKFKSNKAAKLLGETVEATVSKAKGSAKANSRPGNRKSETQGVNIVSKAAESENLKRPGIPTRGAPDVSNDQNPAGIAGVARPGGIVKVSSRTGIAKVSSRSGLSRRPGASSRGATESQSGDAPPMLGEGLRRSQRSFRSITDSEFSNESEGSFRRRSNVSSQAMDDARKALNFKPEADESANTFVMPSEQTQKFHALDDSKPRQRPSLKRTDSSIKGALPVGPGRRPSMKPSGPSSRNMLDEVQAMGYGTVHLHEHRSILSQSKEAKVLGMDDKEKRRMKALMKLGEFQDTVEYKEKAMAVLAPTLKATTTKGEKLLGFSSDQMKRKKAMKMLGTSEETIVEEQQGEIARATSSSALTKATAASSPVLKDSTFSQIMFRSRESSPTTSTSSKPLGPTTSTEKDKSNYVSGTSVAKPKTPGTEHNSGRMKPQSSYSPESNSFRSKASAPVVSSGASKELKILGVDDNDKKRVKALLRLGETGESVNEKGSKPLTKGVANKGGGSSSSRSTVSRTSNHETEEEQTGALDRVNPKLSSNKLKSAVSTVINSIHSKPTLRKSSRVGIEEQTSRLSIATDGSTADIALSESITPAGSPKKQESFVAYKELTPTEKLAMELGHKIATKYEALKALRQDAHTADREQIKSYNKQLVEMEVDYFEKIGTRYPIPAEDIAYEFVYHYYDALDCERQASALLPFYQHGSIFNISGFDKFKGQGKIMKCLIEKFKNLKVEHTIEAVVLDEHPPKRCVLYIKAYGTVRLEDERPRKVLEIFELNYLNKEGFGFSKYFISNQILTVIDSRPMYSWPECEIPVTQFDNGEVQLRQKQAEEEKAKEEVPEAVPEVVEESIVQETFKNIKKNLKNIFGAAAPKLTRNLSGVFDGVSGRMSGLSARFTGSFRGTGGSPDKMTSKMKERLAAANKKFQSHFGQIINRSASGSLSSALSSKPAIWKLTLPLFFTFRLRRRISKSSAPPGFGQQSTLRNAREKMRIISSNVKSRLKQVRVRPRT